MKVLAGSIERQFKMEQKRVKQNKKEHVIKTKKKKKKQNKTKETFKLSK
jgi:hypothetical protein